MVDRRSDERKERNQIIGNRAIRLIVKQSLKRFMEDKKVWEKRIKTNRQKLKLETVR